MTETQNEQKFDELNDDLLKSSEDGPQSQEIPKKVNSKQGLIDKIMKLTEQNIPIDQA